MAMNSIFSNPSYSPATSNPFNIANGTNISSPVLDTSLIEAYNKLESLRNGQNLQQKSTVFTDIASELQDMTDDEREFLQSTKEYQLANNKYQDAFSGFLIEKFANEFLQNNQKTMEELLYVIRNKKEQYKNKFVDDVAEIREQNKELADKNSELVKLNLELQEKLEKIQEKLNI